MSDPWLTIIGLGEDGMTGLRPAARKAIEQAEIIIGGERHLDLGPTVGAKRLAWPHPFGALINTLNAHRGQRLVVITTGDPLWYSIGARIGRAIAPEEITYHPHLSAFQWAAARMGWSLADTDLLTAQGRPVEQILPWLWPGARLLVLTAGAHTAGELARHLDRLGLGSSVIDVFGALGGPEESRTTGKARTWAQTDPTDTLPSFNTLAVAVKGNPPRLLPRGPGLPDAAFQSFEDPLPQDIRAIVLSRLMPARGEVLWAFGHGAEAVAIEWIRAGPEAQAVVLIDDATRLETLREQAAELGAPRITLITGTLPDALKAIPAPRPPQPDLTRPKAVFIGTGLQTHVFKDLLPSLASNGRLVVLSDTPAAENELLANHARHGGDLMRLSVQRLNGTDPGEPASRLLWAVTT